MKDVLRDLWPLFLALLLGGAALKVAREYRHDPVPATMRQDPTNHQPVTGQPYRGGPKTRLPEP